LFALDAVDGSLDLFEFTELPTKEELLAVETRNYLSPGLTEEQAENLVREKVLRVIFQRGFFRLREPQMEIVGQPVKLYMPYWLGFYAGRGTVRCRVMDAVRRQVEGAKASALFEQWLAA
jgi:TolB-like protein